MPGRLIRDSRRAKIRLMVFKAKAGPYISVPSETLADVCRRRHVPQIPWRRVVGMRHRIVHDYMNIDEDILWEVATRSLPELVGLLKPIVPPSD